MPPTVIKLVIVTANDLISCGIQMLVQTTPDIHVMGTVSTIQECEQYLRTRGPHVLLLDDALPGYLSPREVLKHLLSICPNLHVLILSDFLSEHYVHRLIEQGIAGFIYKDDHLQDTLVAGIKTVVQGNAFFSPRASALPYRNTYIDGLNQTDMEVLELLAHGYTVQEISKHVGIGGRSVYRIRTKLRRFLGVRTNEVLVGAAQRRGLLTK